MMTAASAGDAKTTACLAEEACSQPASLFLCHYWAPCFEIP